MTDTTRTPRDDNRIPTQQGVEGLTEKTPFSFYGNKSNHAAYVENKPSEDHIGQVGGKSVVINAQLVRPNNTTAYTAGDEISNSTTAPSIITFPNCARISGGSGVITNLIMTDSASVATKGSFELWLFDAVSTPTADNSATTITDDVVNTGIGVIPIDVNYIGTATAGADGNALYMGTVDRPLPFVCKTGSTALYGRMLVRNAYAAVALETFIFRLFLDQN